MAEPTAQLEDAAQSDAAPATGHPRSDWPTRGWRDLWQAPLLIASIGLLIAGILATRVTAPGPDFDGALDDAEALIANQSYTEALGLLNDVLLPRLEDEGVRASHRRRFHLLRGDAIHRAMIDRDLDLPDNHRSVVEEYLQAEQFLADLQPSRVVALAGALVELDRVDEALDRIDSLPPEEHERKTRLIKRIIENALARGATRYDLAMEMLARLGADPDLSERDRMWVVARATELRLQAGYLEDALAHLLRQLQRLGDVEGVQGAELLLLLAQVYFEMDRLEQADVQIERALAMINEADVLRGRALLLAGRIRQIWGEPQEARDRFTVVVSQFAETPQLLPALVALAEVNAELGATDASLDAFARAVEMVRRGRDDGDVTPASLTASLMREHGERYLREDYDLALRFASLAEDLWGEDAPPAEVLLAISETHRGLADSLLEPARTDQGVAPIDLARVDPVTRARARASYAEAGSYYLRHARALLLTDGRASYDSLWRAADSYDLAGEADRAISAFSEYADGDPEDPRRPGAMYRLARIHLAQSDHEVARRFFQQLIRENPSSPEATRSYVPLAQTFLIDGDEPSARREAERLLTAVVSGEMLGPEALEFRDALIELGRLHLDDERYELAIRRLDEAVRRYPDDPRIVGVRFMLAEAHRHRAGEIEEELREAMPDSERRQLEDRRTRRLAEARGLYDQVVEALEDEDPRRMTLLEQVRLRNAMFYRADCAFDLEDYAASIEDYDRAAQRYADDPASLVALIQIVNAYVAQGLWREAATANERARRRLGELPESAFENAGLPLEPRYWERWFESSATLTRRERDTRAGQQEEGAG